VFVRSILSRPFIQDGWSTAWDASPILCVMTVILAAAVGFGGMALMVHFGTPCWPGFILCLLGAMLTGGIGCGVIFDFIAPRFGTWYVEEDAQDEQVHQ
jgi:hypothetical protein